MTAIVTSRPSAVTELDPAWKASHEGVVKFTVDDLPRLWAADVIPEDTTIELLDGVLVYRDCGDSKGEPGVNGVGHDYVVRVVGKLDRHVDTPDRHMATQMTLLLTKRFAPVPDAMILKGNPAAYRGRQPTPADVLCLIEVADSSYARDSGEKLIAYARGEIVQYIIFNLQSHRAEVYTQPDVIAGTYAGRHDVAVSEVVDFDLGDGETLGVRVGDVMP